MKSPLDIYDEYAKKFNIGADKQLHIRQKQAYVTEQVQQMQMVANRLLCDIVFTSSHLETAKDEATKAAVEGKLRGYENDLRQMSQNLDYAIALSQDFDAQIEKSGEEV